MKVMLYDLYRLLYYVPESRVFYLLLLKYALFYKSVNCYHVYSNHTDV